MTWELVIVAYLILGLMTTWMASVGHKVKFGRFFHWNEWVAGTIGWLPGLLIGLWRRK
jgi:hypothetical protein